MHNTIIGTLMAGFMVWIPVTISAVGSVHEHPTGANFQYEKKADCDYMAKVHSANSKSKYKCVQVPYQRQKRN